MLIYKPIVYQQIAKIHIVIDYTLELNYPYVKYINILHRGSFLTNYLYDVLPHSGTYN
jgi:hypothetical protein